MTRYVYLVVAFVGASFISANVVHAQASNADWIGGTGNWTDGSKWFNDAVGSAGFPPSVDLGNIGRINGGGIVTINTPLADGVDGNGFSTNPGALLIGGVDGVNELTIESGGSLHVAASPGVTNGFFDIGFGGGFGTVRILPGASLDVDGFFSTANPRQNLIQFGAATGAGTATVTAGMSDLRGHTIIHRNANVTLENQLLIRTSSLYQPVISGGLTGKIVANGPVIIEGGELRPDTGGTAPAVGSFWDLFEGGSITGNFTTIDPSLASNLGAGQGFVTSEVSLPGSREALRLWLRQLPVLNINRDTGAVTLSNPGSTGVTLDGYSITSAAGALAPGSWTSLQDANALGGNWQESPSPGNANRLSELKEVGLGTLAPGAQIALGNIFAPTSLPFGQAGEDLSLQFTTTDGNFPGLVTYTGTRVNTLLLHIDPTTGNAQLRNTSTATVQIDGYTIASASGLSLDPVAWNSLDEQNAAGGDWVDSPGTTARLSELKQGGTTTLSPGASFQLGELFDTEQEQDLTFEFLLAGQSAATSGHVLYTLSSGTGVPGDFDNSGTVNGADLTVWKNNFGPGAGADADGDGDSDGADFLIWQRNFGSTGATAASHAVPEPQSLLLLVAALASVAGLGRASRPRA